MKGTAAILMLVISGLVLQNTCPYGFAEKTAAAAPVVHDCPMKSHHSTDGSSKETGRDIRKHFKAFNLLFFGPDRGSAHLHELDRVASMSDAIYADGFAAIPLKPPRHV